MTDDDILRRAAEAFQAKQFAAAASLFQELLSRHPEVPELHINLGASLRGAGDTAAAEAAYKTAIETAPQNALVWFNLANLLRDTDRLHDAIDAFRTADTLQPDTPEILNNLGTALYQAGFDDEAVACYDRLIDVAPGFSDAYTNKGNALQRLLRMEAAGSCFDHALKLAPDNAVYRLNKCAFLAATGRHDEALDWSERAIAADPGYVEARLKKAGLLIQRGELEAGFAQYEARWEMPDWHDLPSKLDMPVWQGEDLTGKHLLVWNEQGYGDALLYARFFPRLSALGAAVTVACEPSLHGLFQTSFDGIALASLDAPLPSADFHISMMSLPHRFNVKTLPDLEAEPYLRPADAAVRNWQERLGQRPSRLRVGVVWAGNPKQAHDYARSIPFETFSPLLAQSGCEFFNLMIGPRGNVRHDNLVDRRAGLTDFAATAAFMSALDLVVSVDSAPAHLAGALGVPVWILLSFDPDSRYFLHSETSPLYSTARLFRQHRPGDWAKVIDDVGAALHPLIAETL